MLGQMVTLYLTQKGFRVSDLSRTRQMRPQTVLMNVLDQKLLTQFLKEHEYDAVVNCAALLGAACDQHPAEAAALNAWFPHFLEENFRESRTKVIQISTDAVFAPGPEGRLPTAPCAPDTFYGRTKLAGELYNRKDLTIRSAFWGPDQRQEGTGLMNWFLQSSGTVDGYRNVIFNGVTSLECAQFIEKAITEDMTGIYHLCARDPLSKYDLLFMLRDIFDCTDTQIEPVDHPISTRLLSESRLGSGKTYSQMLSELVCWMGERPGDYFHYPNITAWNRGKLT